MPRQPLEQVGKIAMTVVALIATAMALYVQVFEARSRHEEARRAALRLEEALARSRTQLKAEILAALRAEIAGWKSAEPGTQPIPDTVLRRLDSDEISALQQALDPMRPGESLTPARLAARIELLARRMEESDRALRRDLEEFRGAIRLELEASGKATSLILVALVPLVVHLLYSFWQDRDRDGERGKEKVR